MIRALVVIADGSEEMEAGMFYSEIVIPIDILRRAGIQVTVAGLDSSEAVECSRHVKIVPDFALSELDSNFEMLVLPGGSAAKALAASKKVLAIDRDS